MCMLESKSMDEAVDLADVSMGFLESPNVKQSTGSEGFVDLLNFRGFERVAD